MAEAESDMKLPWRQVAFACLVIAASSVGALVVVASLKKADPLSTVALALAVLAFAAQLVIAIAQGNSANQQLLQSERVNTQTQSLLSEIRSGSNELTLTVRQQFDFVLRHALGAAVPRAVREAGLTDLGPRDLQRLETALGASLSAPSLNLHANSQNVDANLIGYMESFPSEEEAGDTTELLMTLNPLEVSSLRVAAQFEVEDLRVGQSEIRNPLARNSPGGTSLLNRGLFEKVPAPDPDDDRIWVRLTDRGRAVARLLLARNPPAWFLDRVMPESKNLDMKQTTDQDLVICRTLR